MNTLKVKAFWEKCTLEYAHNEVRRHLKDYNNLTKCWEDGFLNQINFEDTIVLDYGIGGGYLGKYLFDTRKIKSYIGVDIAERSLHKAKDVLSNYNNVELIHTDLYYKSFQQPIDIFVCQAVIQHFFSIDYFNTFLRKIESLKPNIVMLQIAYSKETQINTSYKNESDVARACTTNSNYILQHLPSYHLKYEGPVLRNNYQFLIFHRV